MTRFLLIRHAVTDSVGKRLSGRKEGVYVNDEGSKQAQKLGDRLAGYPIGAIYSSPLERAMETATPISHVLGLETKISSDFMELDFGAWTNRTFEELQNDLMFQRFNSFRSCTRVPGGESMPEAQLRFVGGMEKLRLQHHQQSIAIVSHSDLIKAAVAYYAGIPLDLFQRIEISPASITIIDIYEDTARILCVNNTGSIKL